MRMSRKSKVEGRRLGHRPLASEGGFRPESGFTLLEVLIACAVFFMVAFAILGMVAASLGAARRLQIREPDAGLLAAEFSLTNLVTEGVESGDFNESYPGIYQGYTWQRDSIPDDLASNGLWRVDFHVFPPAGKKTEPTVLHTLVFSPSSQAGRQRLGVSPR